MASFTNYRAKIDKRIEKAIEVPVFVVRKPGEERVNTNLRALTPNGMEINLENFNKYKIIAKEFNNLSQSILDTMMLLSSWVSHNKINTMEKDAIVNYIVNK